MTRYAVRIILAVFSFLIFSLTGVGAVSAATLTDASYRLSHPVAGAYADHTLVFRSTSGVSSGSIVVSFSNLLSSFGLVSISDIDLMYGGVQASLASTPGAGVWGVAIGESDKTITFSYPTTGGQAVSAGNMVLVTIGKNSHYQAQGVRQAILSSSSGSMSLGVVAGSDTGTLSIVLFSVAQENTEMINAARGNGLPISVAAGQNNGQVGVSLVAEDSTGVTANRIDQGGGVSGIFAPSNALALPTKEGVISISWKDNSQIELGYIVERKQIVESLGKTFDPVAILDRNSTTYTDTNLPSELIFQYRVRAYNDVNFSAYATSSEVMTIKLAVPQAPFGNFIPSLATRVSIPTSQQQQQVESPKNVMPSPPANVLNLAGVPGEGSVRLVWENPDDPNVLYVQIQWSDKGFVQSPSDGVTVYKENGSFFKDENLPNEQASYYTVYVVDNYGQYSSGALIAVTPSGPPPAPVPVVAAPAPTVSTSVPVSAVSSSEPVAQEVSPPPVTLSLAPPVTQTFLPTTEGVVRVVNTDSSGGAQTLSVVVSAATVSAPYKLSVSSYSVDQVKEIDPTISLNDDQIIGAQTVYQVTVQKESTEIHRFDKPITLRFSYAESSLGDIDVSTLHIRYWDPLVSQWINIPSHVDTEKKIVEGTTNHASLFSIFGTKEKGASSVQVKVIPQSKVSRPNLPSLKVSGLFDISQFIHIAGRDLVAEAGSNVQLCVNQELFSQPVRFMTLAIDAAKYFLVYDIVRRCYATTVIMPQAVGSHTMDVKVVFANDFSQNGSFTLQTTAKKAGISLPAPLAAAAQKTAPLWPLIAFSIVLLCVEGALGVYLYRCVRK